jgi:type VI secretion system secreted protein VgrG
MTVSSQPREGWSERTSPYAAAAEQTGAPPPELALSRVRYRFESEARGAAGWSVSEFALSESLSASYEARLRLVTVDAQDAGSLLGRACTLVVERDDCRRYVHGIVSRVQGAPLAGQGMAADVSIVPALHALGQRLDSRIFQDKTIPEVLALVLEPALAPYGRRCESRLRRTTYPRREYLVQYRETDLAFVQRLMGEEGIWFYFEQPRDSRASQGELMVMVDSNEDAQLADLGHTGDELPMQRDASGKAQWQSVTRLELEQMLSPTSVTVREYNWTNPAVVEARLVPHDAPGDRPSYEPGDLTPLAYEALRFSKFDTVEQARMRWEYHRSTAVRSTGSGNVVGLIPGQKVVVSGQSSELDGEWIVLSVQAQGQDAKNLQQGVAELEDYQNTFTCVRNELPYRPARLAKPRVQGVQTATVVGPDRRPAHDPGEDDIHTDAHGRVQVKLSWDRTDPIGREASVTCFVRVMQALGGNGWGFMFIPRIGMEVILSFIEGDPDRPLVTGCVYNGLQRAAHALPAEKTKSYIRTRSSPSGKGGNELQFEDADGRQQIYLHAQRDHREVVEHDQVVHVKASQAIEVGCDRTETVGGDERTTIKRTRTHTVHGNDTLLVVDGGTRTLEVSGDETKRIANKRELVVSGCTKERYRGGRETNVQTADVLNVLDGANKSDHVSGQYTITADEHFKVQQGRDQLYMKESFYVSSSGDVQLKNDGFHLFAKQGGKTTLQVDRQLEIVVGRSSITMNADGTIELAGPSAVKLTARGGSVEASTEGVTSCGQKATLQGLVTTEITGPMVKIN